MYQKHSEYRHNTKGNGDAPIRHWDTRQLAYYQRDDQFKWFHFANLSFAHQPDGKKQHRKQYNCPNKND